MNFLAIRSYQVMGVGVLLFGMLGGLAGGRAANWPAWRGPKGTGWTPETNLPLRWSADENVRWKTALPGPGNSTPIVWENKVFLTQSLPDENRLAVLCFDRTDGELLWQSDADQREKEETHRANPYGSPSPVTDGERVIAWFGSTGVFAFDMEGKELWHRDLGRQSHIWGYASSPVIYEDVCLLYFGPGERRFLVALDKQTGETVWRKAAPAIEEAGERTDGFRGRDNGVIGSFSTPLIVQAEDRDELVMSFPQQLRAYAPRTGKPFWSCDGLNPLVYTSPIYGEGIVVAMGGFKGTTVAVEPGGEGDVTGSRRLWMEQRTRDRLGSGVIHEGHIYVLDTPGIAVCMELRTGDEVWEHRLPAEGPKSESWSSMVLSGERIYILNQSGDTIVLKASPEYEVLAVNSLGYELTNASLAVAHGNFYIRTHEHLWCIGSPATAAIDPK